MRAVPWVMVSAEPTNTDEWMRTLALPQLEASVWQPG